MHKYTVNFFGKATKEKDAGRASGGLAIFIKNEQNFKISFIENTHFWLVFELWHKNAKYILFFTYLKPSLDILFIDLLYS